jgi:seryl-tRNA synthetase
MLDLRQVREEEAAVREGLARRGNPELLMMLDRVLLLDAERRELIAEVDALRARRNEASPRVAEFKRAGAHEEAEAVIREMREVGEAAATKEARLGAVEEEIRGLLLHLPNLPAPEVPPGGVESNRVLREWGDVSHFDFAP